MKTTTKKPRTSEGSGKTRGAVSLASVHLSDLLVALGNPRKKSSMKVQIGRVFGETIGLKLRKSRKKGVAPEMVLTP